MKAPIFATVLLVSSAFGAVKKTEVYQVIGMTRSASASGWTVLKTRTGSTVNVRCSTLQFDDSVRDRVSGFSSEKECEEFLATIEKSASPANPVEVLLADNFDLIVKTSL